MYVHIYIHILHRHVCTIQIFILYYFFRSLKQHALYEALYLTPFLTWRLAICPRPLRLPSESLFEPFAAPRPPRLRAQPTPPSLRKPRELALFTPGSGRMTPTTGSLEGSRQRKGETSSTRIRSLACNHVLGAHGRRGRATTTLKINKPKR